MTDTTNQVFCKGIFVCERASINEQRLLSLHNVVDKLFVRVAPQDMEELGTVVKKVDIPMDVVVFFERQGLGVAEIHEKFALRFIDPKGVVLVEPITIEAHIDTFSRRSYAHIQMGGVPCAQSGMHTFEVITADSQKVIGKENFEIVMVDEGGVAINR